MPICYVNGVSRRIANFVLEMKACRVGWQGVWKGDLKLLVDQWRLADGINVESDFVQLVGVQPIAPIEK